MSYINVSFEETVLFRRSLELFIFMCHVRRCDGRLLTFVRRRPATGQLGEAPSGVAGKATTSRARSCLSAAMTAARKKDFDSPLRLNRSIYIGEFLPQNYYRLN